jgi:hypothetical protein
MRRIELQQMLPAGTLSERSQNDVLQGVVTATLSDAGTATVSGTRSEAGGRLASTGDALAGLLDGSAKDVTTQVSALTSQITSLAATQQTQVGATEENTQAVAQNTTARSGGSDIGSTIGTVASSILGGGLSLLPLVSGLMRLFGGDDSQSSSTAPSKFVLPPPVQYEAGLVSGSSGSVAPVSYGQSGQVRPEVSAAPQISIQVSAMDSRSFLDHSDEIARAVKDAMLNSNSLNDVISDL